MKKLRIYLDTSVINFRYADDAPDVRRVTEEFFAEYAGRNELYGSDVLLRELGNDPDPERRKRHMDVLRRHDVAMLPSSRDDEVVRLADAYLKQEIVTVKNRDDALHVA